MYFTSDLRYANMYAEIQAKTNNPTGPWGANVFLIAAVLPGNPFPVTEHPFPKRDKDGKPLSPAQFEMDPALEGKRKRNPFGLLGQACKAGYQSHYTIVDSVHSASAFPTQHGDFDDPTKKRVVSDELVVFEGAQALPLFLVYYKTPPGKAGAGSTTGAVAAVVSSGGEVEVVRKEMFSGGSSASSSVQGKFSLLVLVCSPCDIKFSFLFD